MTRDEGQHELDAIHAVAARVADAFGSRVSLERVRTAVDAHYRRFEGSRVRTYIPLLVEHEVRDEVRSWVDASEASVAQ
ncbi:hypothetical protein KGA66_21990 [Actinocrinis puniceicyclus]|uniref:DUF3562 domain-containing protein n=1 Tax=Actinocrinis puniceicyclus TaxID=977794 RepID=A0A8J8BGG3_9ACTN|nr:hypothetical protein [Actinocrinis puniceicyclus]MBS2965739.1 hypothetical protein [Actinocrinis puniceicyclus]